MTHFTIDIRALKATAIAYSKDKTRYYLEGVCVEYAESGPIFVATDGHRLICTRHDWIDAKAEQFDPVIIPMDLIKRIKISKKIDVAEITLEKSGTARVIKITYCGAMYTESEIAGTFPNWRAVMPREHSGEFALFNADYVCAFKDAIKLLGGSEEPLIQHNGGNPAFVDFGGIEEKLQSFGVIMPMRMQGRSFLTQTPAWSLTPQARAEREKETKQPEMTDAEIATTKNALAELERTP